MKNTSCHRCHGKDTHDNKVLDFDGLEYPLCQKCISFCIDKSWKFFLKYRVFGVSYPKPEQASTEEEFECYIYLKQIVDYDRSPYKPSGSVQVFGRGRWKIGRFALYSMLLFSYPLLYFLLPFNEIETDNMSLKNVIGYFSMIGVFVILYGGLFLGGLRILRLLNLIELYTTVKKNKS